MNNKMNEAMALAAMTPVCGMQGPHSGSFIVNVSSRDKDLGENPKRFTGIANSLDMDDNLYGIDNVGRVYAAKKYDIMEKEDIVEAYRINTEDADRITYQLIQEAELLYDERPIHQESSLYEIYTKKELLTADQYDYDLLLEKVELDKMSSAIQGVADSNLSRAKNLEQKGNKSAHYIPDNDFPTRTDEINDYSMNEGFGFPRRRHRKIGLFDLDEDYDITHGLNDSVLLKQVSDTKFYLNEETMYDFGKDAVYKYYLEPEREIKPPTDLVVSNVESFVSTGEYDENGDLIFLSESTEKIKDYDGARKYWKAEYNASEEEYMKKLVFKKFDFPNTPEWKYFINVPQPAIMLGKDESYRFRCELIVINQHGEILVNIKKPFCFPYSFPGGGIDFNESIAECAARECKEEARIVAKNVEYMDIAWYCKFYTKSIYTGVVSFVCVGMYQKEYKGYIKVKDRDTYVNNMKWVYYEDIELAKCHKLAIERYLKEG